MGMILRIASSRIVGQGDIVGRSGYFSLNLSANSVMRGRLDARRTLKSLVADLRHNNYKKTAAEKNKLGFRTLAGINLYNQVDDAEKIDSALTKRAEVEALNVADRQIDLAWLAESSKINGQLDKMKANIDHIIPTGGTINDKRRWEELYNMYQCAVKATKDAYMPNAQRKRQYLSIYADLTTQNETLLKYLVQLNTQSQTTALLAATNDRVVHKGSIISDAKSRWQENMKGVRSSTGTDGDDANSGEGEESVNR